MPDINEPTEAEIEAVKADQQWWQQVEEPLGLRLGGWTFRKRAQFFDISTGAAIELPGSVAERVIAARRVSSASSFADVRIKPLEWHSAEERGSPTKIMAPGLGGSYECRVGVWEGGWIWLRPGSEEYARVEDEDEAKAAAQADYEQRIRSALDIVPAPSFADGIEAAAKVMIELGTAPLEGTNIRIGIGNAIAAAIRALAHNPQASGGGSTVHRGEKSVDAKMAILRESITSSEPPHDGHTDPPRSGAAEGNEAEATAPSLKDAILDAARHVRAQPAGRRGPYVISDERLDGIIERLGPKSDASGAPKPDPAIAELVERAWQTLVEMDDRTSPEEYPEHALITKSELAEFMGSTASNDRVAELERERDEAREDRNFWEDRENKALLRAIAAEAEVSRLKAGAVTDEMVEAAARAIWLNLCGDIRQMPADVVAYSEAARAALEAALSNQAGASK